MLLGRFVGLPAFFFEKFVVGLEVVDLRGVVVVAFEMPVFEVLGARFLGGWF